MFIEKLLNHSFKKSLFLAGVIIAGASAHAVEVTQLIHFDDAANNGLSDYTTDDGNFFFDPTNFNSDTKCAPSVSGGNGSCLQELTQGGITTMTRVTPGGSDFTYDLDSFYFNLVGNGTGNAITVTANGGIPSPAAMTFVLGSSYANITTEDGLSFNGNLEDGVGYFAVMTGIEGFQDITSAVFGADRTASVRLDCISATFDGTTNEPASGFSGGCGIQEVPIPAAAWLFGSGLLGLVGMSRRRKS